MNKHLSYGLPVYAGGSGKFALFIFDNHTFVIRSYSETEMDIELVVKGEHTSLTNLTTDSMLSIREKLPEPNCMSDGVTVIDEPSEYLYKVTVAAGEMQIYRIGRELHS